MASIGLIEAAVERKMRGQHHDDERRDDQHDDEERSDRELDIVSEERAQGT